MMYELVIGVGVIILLVFMWTLLTHVTKTTVNVAKNTTPLTVANETINQTAIFKHYDYAYSVVYFSLFLLVFLVFIYIIKKAVQAQAGRWWGG